MCITNMMPIQCTQHTFFRLMCTRRSQIPTNHRLWRLISRSRFSVYDLTLQARSEISEKSCDYEASLSIIRTIWLARTLIWWVVQGALCCRRDLRCQTNSDAHSRKSEKHCVLDIEDALKEVSHEYLTNWVLHVRLWVVAIPDHLFETLMFSFEGELGGKLTRDPTCFPGCAVWETAWATALPDCAEINM